MKIKKKKSTYIVTAASLLVTAGAIGIGIGNISPDLNSYADTDSASLAQLRSLVGDDNLADCIIAALLEETDSPDINTVRGLEVLDCSNDEDTPESKKIRNVTALRNFTSLKELDLGYNLIEQIDLSSNPNLEILRVNDNAITNLDLSGKENLSVVWAHNNQLSSINVGDSRLLEVLYVDGNNLSSIDVSNNTNLTSLSVFDNRLSSLDVSTNNALTDLRVENNNFASIDLSNKPNLVNLSIDNIVVDAGVKPVIKSGSYEYNLSSLGFIKGTISGLKSGTYDSDNKVLTIASPSLEGGVAQISSDEEYSSFKLKLNDVEDPTPTPDPDPDTTPDPDPTPKSGEKEDLPVPSTSSSEDSGKTSTTTKKPNTGASTKNGSSDNDNNHIALFIAPIVISFGILLCNRLFGKNKKRKFDK